MHLLHPRPGMTPNSMAADFFAQLQRHEIDLVVLQRAEVLGKDELGLYAAEYFAALDFVFRKLYPGERPSSLPFAGRLLLGTGDPAQLPPVHGRPFWVAASLETHCKASADV